MLARARFDACKTDFSFFEKKRAAFKREKLYLHHNVMDLKPEKASCFQSGRMS